MSEQIVKILDKKADIKKRYDAFKKFEELTHDIKYQYLDLKDSEMDTVNFIVKYGFLPEFKVNEYFESRKEITELEIKKKEYQDKINELREFLYKEKEKNIIKINGQKELNAKDIVIAGDPSAAAIVGSAALITPQSEIKIKKVNMNKTRITFFNILKKMNAKIKIFNKKEVSNEQVADITFKSSNLKGVHLGKKTVANMIDEIPIFSILATFAEGNSSFIGGNELKNKESNRIKSLYEGLTACKIKVKKKMDGLQITGNGKDNIFVNAKIKTYYDHRIAMAFLVMGLASKKKIIVDNINCIKTSFPNFLTLMKDIGANFPKKIKKKLLKSKKTA